MEHIQHITRTDLTHDKLLSSCHMVSLLLLIICALNYHSLGQLHKSLRQEGTCTKVQL